MVVGANGQLGVDIASEFDGNGDSVCAVTHANVEISDADSVFRTVRDAAPDLVVNTAAMHHVENCERDPERAFSVNAIGARNLANVVHDLGAILIHISTDYVFDGAKASPYIETDSPRPVNVYGNSKLAGEYFVQSGLDRHFVLRTSGLYGHNPCRAKGRNFIELMLKLAEERREVRVVDSEWVTPTSTRELARQIVGLSRSDAYGLYHATAEAGCSWYEYAQEIFRLTDAKVDLRVADPGEFPAKVRRPRYSVLENGALKRNGLNQFRHWREGLCEYLGVLCTQ
jgi:dTDP-4-dehydrorhamnose reductase